MRAYKQFMVERKVEVLCFDESIAAASILNRKQKGDANIGFRDKLRFFANVKYDGEKFEFPMVWKEQVVDPMQVDRGTFVPSTDLHKSTTVAETHNKVIEC